MDTCIHYLSLMPDLYALVYCTRRRVLLATEDTSYRCTHAAEIWYSTATPYTLRSLSVKYYASSTRSTIKVTCACAVRVEGNMYRYTLPVFMC